MAKESDQDNIGDEYTYAEEENYEEAYPVKRPNPMKSVVAKLTAQKRLLAIIGAIIIFYIVFRVINAVEHKNATNKTLQKAPVAETKKAPNNSANHAKNLNHINQLYESSVNQHANLRQLENNVANINNKLYNIQQGLDNLTSRLRNLESVVARQVRLEQEREQLAMQKIQKRARKTYRVYAVIPNRAWIFGPQGQTITVRVGSHLPEVGTVIGINPVTGTVVTSSGARITFALNDI